MAFYRAACGKKKYKTVILSAKMPYILCSVSETELNNIDQLLLLRKWVHSELEGNLLSNVL